MNIRETIHEVNTLLTQDLMSHHNNNWIKNNIATPIVGNQYESLRLQSSVYCLSSMHVMINHYRTKMDFQNNIITIISNFLQTNFSNEGLVEIVNWVLVNARKSIKLEGSDPTDLNNIGWWIGNGAYISCIVSNNYRAQFEKIFLEAWNMYCTNDFLDSIR